MGFQYDLKGRIYILRDNGEEICLSHDEIMGVVEIAIGAADMPLDKDEIYRYTADSLNIERCY